MAHNSKGRIWIRIINNNGYFQMDIFVINIIRRGPYKIVFGINNHIQCIVTIFDGCISICECPPVATRGKIIFQKDARNIDRNCGFSG